MPGTDAKGQREGEKQGKGDAESIPTKSDQRPSTQHVNAIQRQRLRIGKSNGHSTGERKRETGTW